MPIDLMEDPNKTKKKTNNHQIPYNRLPNYLAWGLVIIVVLLTAAVRVHLLEVPLERDEGEYAYNGQLILQGIWPYAKAYNLKMPGIYAAYALILKVFGQTHVGVHLGLLVVNAATIILVFLLGWRLLDPLAGVVAGASYAALALSLSVQGVFANAEHFVVLPAIGGLLLLVRAIDSDRQMPIFWSGLLLGVAFVMKQHGWAFVAFGGFYLICSQLIRRPVGWAPLASKCGLFASGVGVPLVLTSLALFSAGVFEKFWFWTFHYAIEYVSLVPLSTGFYRFKRRMSAIVLSSPVLWLLSGVGLSALVWDKKSRSRSLFVASFLVFSFLSVCPGLYFRPHYFVLLLPAIALLVGTAISSMERIVANTDSTHVRRGIPIALVVIALLHSVYTQRVTFHIGRKKDHIL